MPGCDFAALMHDLGKAQTPRSEWPAHHGHEERSVLAIEALATRLRVPGDYRELAVIVARYHGIVHRAFELKPRTVLEFIGTLRRLPPAGAIRARVVGLRGGLEGPRGVAARTLSATRLPACGARCRPPRPSRLRNNSPAVPVRRSPSS